MARLKQRAWVDGGAEILNSKFEAPNESDYVFFCSQGLLAK